MNIRLLKLSNNEGKEDLLTAQDILSMHLGYYLMNGKVTYSTDLPIKDKPEYVILTPSKCPVCYWCHVVDHDYKDGKKIKQENTEFERYSPDKYKGDSNVSWLLLDSMKEFPKEFLKVLETNNEVKEFIDNRANNKKITG